MDNSKTILSSLSTGSLELKISEGVADIVFSGEVERLHGLARGRHDIKSLKVKAHLDAESVRVVSAELNLRSMPKQWLYKATYGDSKLLERLNASLDDSKLVERLNAFLDDII
jgi:hypothetical protein